MNKQVREEFEKAYPMPFACGWNSMANEYQCIWDEHAGEEEVEAAIDQHNDRLAVWVASRQAIEFIMGGESDETCFPISVEKYWTEQIIAAGLRINP